MFAVVEFMSSEEDVSSGELAIVPLLWIHKQEKKCYWPITTKKLPFPQFVKNQTPMNKTWPSYSIFKIHFKTDTYEKADEKLNALLEGLSLDQESLSNMSGISYTKKTLIGDSDSSSSDSESEQPPPKKANTQHLKTSNVSNTNTSTSTTTSPAFNPTVPVLSLASGPKSSSHLKKYTVSASTTPVPSSVDSGPSTTSNLSENMVDLSHECITQVMNIATKIQAEVENHSIILNELLRQNRKINADKLIAPSNLPSFPIREHNIFLNFNELLTSDSTVYDYMVKRLAAVGGGGIQSHTRRILKYIMSDDVALLYNWKGRDKLSFQKIPAMTLIYEAAKLNYPNEERNDLLIENTVKDYLKFAKTRLNAKKNK